MDGFWSVLVVMIVAGDENESLTSLETALSYTYIAMTFLADRGINGTRALTRSSIGSRGDCMFQLDLRHLFKTDRTDAVSTGRIQAVTANKLSSFLVTSPHFCSMLQSKDKD